MKRNKTEDKIRNMLALYDTNSVQLVQFIMCMCVIQKFD